MPPSRSLQKACHDPVRLCHQSQARFVVNATYGSSQKIWQTRPISTRRCRRSPRRRGRQGEDQDVGQPEARLTRSTASAPIATRPPAEAEVDNLISAVSIRVQARPYPQVIPWSARLICSARARPGLLVQQARQQGRILCRAHAHRLIAGADRKSRPSVRPLRRNTALLQTSSRDNHVQSTPWSCLAGGPATCDRVAERVNTVARESRCRQ